MSSARHRENCGRSRPTPIRGNKSMRTSDMDAAAIPIGDLLLLSPHLDDAVLSATTLLERSRTTVWTVFAGAPSPDMATEWDRRCGYETGAALIRDRRSEDASALAGVDFEQLPLLERAY